MNSQNGSSMIEVLVAIVIFSIGLLGAMKLQMVALESNKSGFDRSLALVAANDMAERMRANPKGDYTNFSSKSTGGSVDCSSSCSPDEIVQLDYYEWGSQFQNNLIPQGEAIVSKIDEIGNYSIQISWYEKEWTEGAIRDNKLHSVTIYVFI